MDPVDTKLTAMIDGAYDMGARHALRLAASELRMIASFESAQSPIFGRIAAYGLRRAAAKLDEFSERTTEWLR